MSGHRFAVRVKPGAAKPYVGGTYGGADDDPGALIVSVHAPAADGGANEAVIKTLASVLGVRGRCVVIVAGHSSRTKRILVTVDDNEDARLIARINSLLTPWQGSHGADGSDRE